MKNSISHRKEVVDRNIWAREFRIYFGNDKLFLVNEDSLETLVKNKPGRIS